MVKTGGEFLFIFDGSKNSLRMSYLLLGVMFFSGCMSSGRVERLVTLKNLANEQKEVNAYINQQDENFRHLLEVIRENRLNEFPDAKSIEKHFGQPIFIKKNVNGEIQEEWLFRYAVNFFHSDKVYLYFDKEGRLINWKVLKKGGDDGKIREKTS